MAEGKPRGYVSCLSRSPALVCTSRESVRSGKHWDIMDDSRHASRRDGGIPILSSIHRLDSNIVSMLVRSKRRERKQGREHTRVSIRAQNEIRNV
jgi:hypothetical protein